MTAKCDSWKTLVTGLLALVVVAGLAACGDDHDSLTKRVHNAEDETETNNQNPRISQEWEQRDTYSISGFSGKTFYVLDRKKQVGKYPCTNCHTESFELQKSRKSRERPKRAHWEIEIDHGASSRLENFDCATCHDLDNPDEFRGPARRSYSFNESFRQCGTCHQKQLTDWAGGAHGKRHDYWQGSRVIYNCADCHNPHDPSIKKRWPVTYPSIPRKSKGLNQ